jgi:hypothetical protein
VINLIFMITDAASGKGRMAGLLKAGPIKKSSQPSQ